MTTETIQSKQPLIDAHKHLCDLKKDTLTNLRLEGYSLFFENHGAKCEVYLAGGGRLYWIIDGERRFSFPGDKPELISQNV